MIRRQMKRALFLFALLLCASCSDGGADVSSSGVQDEQDADERPGEQDAGGEGTEDAEAGGSDVDNAAPDTVGGDPDDAGPVEPEDAGPVEPEDAGPVEPEDTGEEAEVGVDVVEEDPRMPLSPTVCSELNRGECQCNDAPGFTTYTWWVAQQQRCATVYVPPSAQGPLPVLLTQNCYTANALGECQEGSEMVEAANRFGFAGVCTTAADGNWTFANDGVVNDQNPAPCSERDSKDITYLNGVFAIIDALGDASIVDPDQIFAWGFSQNAMFSAYTAFCFPERVKGFWQGGSGLFVAGETSPLPQMEGACRRSDFLEHGRDCAQVAPCEECQYFPVYPVSTTPAQRACVMAYRDDFLFETASPMASRMMMEGHAATLLHFPDIGRGHSNPLQPWDWIVGCLGVVPPCSAQCAEAVSSCVEGRGAQDARAREGHYNDCVAENTVACAAGCAPTISMLSVIERPCLVDGQCQEGETSSTCPEDCGGDPDPEPDDQLPSCEELGRMERCCGDDVCDGPENARNCVRDCQ